MIEVTGVSKKYRGRLAVDNLSFRVKPGKVTGFLGPNGSGKSTTMRLMLGLSTGKGSTLYDSKPLTSYEKPSSIVGILLEAKAFHPTRTAYDHLSVLATAGGMSQDRVDEVLDIVGLSDVAELRPGKFSLGMSQRLGIAAALLGEPKYLLLDEPANGLDPEGIAWLRKFIKNYAKEGNGVLVSSHLLSEMALMADDIIVIGKGKMITNSSVAKIIASNSNPSVFVRSSNQTKLAKFLKTKKVKFEKQDDGLIIYDLNVDKVGQLAFKAGVTTLELTARSASLEDAFLELTSSSQEYKAGKSND